MNGRFQNLGWVVAAALGGILVAGGFEGNEQKLGTVDVAALIQQSEMGREGQTQFDAMTNTRQDLVNFMVQNTIMSADQAKRLRDLWLKSPRTPPEEQEFTKLQNDIRAASKAAQDLQLKQNLTPEDKKALDDATNKNNATRTLAQQWTGEFHDDIQKWADQRRQASLDKAKAAIQQTAKAQGFSIIFEAGVAPYAANDVTSEAVKQMNKK